MSATRTADPKVTPCRVHRKHSPRPRLIVLHHVIPESWTKYLGLPEGVLMPICGTGHDNVHTALRRWVLYGERPRYMRLEEWNLVATAHHFWETHPELHAKAKVLLDGR